MNNLIKYIEYLGLRFISSDNESNHITTILNDFNYKPIYDNIHGDKIILKRYGIEKFTDKIPECNGHVSTITAVGLYRNEVADAILFKTDDPIINLWLHDRALYCMLSTADNDLQCMKDMFNDICKVKSVNKTYTVAIGSYAMLANNTFGWIN